MFKLKLTINDSGFTLVELVLIILLLGIIATVAIRQMSSTVDTAKYEQTMKELEQIAYAIAGNPNLFEGGSRSNYGYVGDIGALPPNLDALTTNPGFGTWAGPYIISSAGSDFKKDGWNVDYVYTDSLLRSIGSGTNIDKIFANSTAALLSNTIEGFIVDAQNTPPGIDYVDSLIIRLSYPDGAGSNTTQSVNPNRNGNFSLSSIPIGQHQLSVIYIPDSDTTTYNVSVNPGITSKLTLTFPSDLF